MAPPAQGLQLDIDAISGICGSISIACWVVVFSPQIIENFRRSSADGLSLQFLVIWLAGDVFNILGGVLQGVLPTMIILALYYTLADIVLLCQCFYYRGFTLSDSPPKPTNGQTNERAPLLSAPNSAHHSRHASFTGGVSGEHLSPATPLVSPPKGTDRPREPPRPTSLLQSTLYNSTAILMVCAAGIFGWWVSIQSKHHTGQHESPPASPPAGDDPSYDDELIFSFWGQIFGYLCAFLYLGSRIPQIKLNWERKSTEGVSILFFLFACVGNLMYVLSILAFSPIPLCHEGAGINNILNGNDDDIVARCGPGEQGAIYGRYMLVNASWLLGSFGTLFLDLIIFVQFFLYRNDEWDISETASEEAVTD